MRRRLDGRASRVFQVDLAPGVKVDMPANALATYLLPLPANREARA